jgi:hypothetical protein
MTKELAATLRRSSDAVDAMPGSEHVAGAVASCPLGRHWIAIELLGEDNKGVADEPYVITFPDGTQRKGKLDARGTVRLDGLPVGTYRMCFPALDQEAWEIVGSK